MVMLLHLLYGKPSKEFNEIYRDEYIKDMLAQCKKFGTSVENHMLMVHTPFQTEGKKDVAAYKVVLDEKDYDGSSLVAIHLSFQKLLASLRQPLQRRRNCKRSRHCITIFLIVFCFRYSSTESKVKNGY